MLTNKSLCFIYLSKSSLAITRQICSQSILAEDHYVAGITNLSDSLEKKLEGMQQQQQSTSSNTSIYRVPSKLNKIEPRAYEPHFISIGPYHRGSSHLQNSERLKWDSLKRVVGLGGARARDKRHNLLCILDDIEPKARGCYSEDVELSRDAFVEMMLLDGCFIVELFRDLQKNNFVSSSLLSKRWMLPVVRRDLITLENQLPMIVLKKIFEQTMIRSDSNSKNASLEELALNFFDPLMPREGSLLQQSIDSVTSSSQNFHHLLDVFHSSISQGLVSRGKEPHMYRSVAELKEAGIKVRVLGNSQPLEVRFSRGMLRIPSLQIDNHTGSFFRNIVAYEQCHHECMPHMTAYLFFLDKLINSAQDVGLLHYEGVMQHTLGSNKEVAKLINKLCIEVEHDGQDSYLYDVVQDINAYSNNWLIKAKTRLKHDYFSNLWAGISTIAALLLLYLTLLQTSCDAIEAQEKELQEKKGSWVGLTLFLLHPIKEFMKIVCSALSKIASFIGQKDPSDDPQ
ncbi:hypothetical protein RDABS01_013039 [Bienertia sinuspersici]